MGADHIRTRIYIHPRFLIVGAFETRWFFESAGRKRCVGRIVMWVLLGGDLNTSPLHAPCQAGLYVCVENRRQDSRINVAINDQTLRLHSRKKTAQT